MEVRNVSFSSCETVFKMEEIEEILDEIENEFPNVKYFFSDTNRERILHNAYQATLEDTIKYGGKTKSKN